MTVATTNLPTLALAGLVDRHGAGATLAALVAVLVGRARARRKSRLRARRDVTALSPHLRRDIGLPPHAPAPRHWEIR